MDDNDPFGWRRKYKRDDNLSAWIALALIVGMLLWAYFAARHGAPPPYDNA